MCDDFVHISFLPCLESHSCWKHRWSWLSYDTLLCAQCISQSICLRPAVGPYSLLPSPTTQLAATTRALLNTYAVSSASFRHTNGWSVNDLSHIKFWAGAWRTSSSWPYSHSPLRKTFLKCKVKCCAVCIELLVSCKCLRVQNTGPTGGLVPYSYLVLMPYSTGSTQCGFATFISSQLRTNSSRQMAQIGKFFKIPFIPAFQ
jgi:hypothetical protein